MSSDDGYTEQGSYFSDALDAVMRDILQRVRQDQAYVECAMVGGKHWMAYLHLPLPATDMTALLAEIMEVGL